MNLKQHLAIASVAILSLCSSAVSAQQSYPEHPIKLIVPFGPGGVTDLTGRTYARYMSEDLGQPIVVENKPGGGATIGANYVVKSKPDGYTILLGTNVTHSINPQLMRSIPYDALKDFEPIGIFGTNGNVLVVNKDFPANTFKEFVEVLKSKKQSANYASASIGSSAHMAAELLKQEVPGLEYMHVPYGGPSEAMTALIGGQVDFLFANIGAAVSQIKAGKVKAIAVSTSKRFAELPDVPTIGESVPGFEVVGWIAAFAPKGTPPAIVERLNTALNNAQQRPELQKTLDAAALVRRSATSAETAEFVQAEYSKWGRVIRDGKIPLVN
ncbi:tripartite tricarboxylate transporter substrate binding protein [Pusillimonas sp. ANT_WB101]|uniref:Bug family tripartite tricarboxylate transporter substrate binding protein n=1 Tax=Pusillimonas sp. ANT_WB101 TaxID=2597356 RepID=UPI0011EC11C5|nr:tripartite tricarboxylate transporter substrate binding protein [Pusillimonas sp. ANT_WB101]KAA0889416.1 tripartite tricarboxylate transporter substrate binding protein [Pusillimonas sp. ANT_WB101]